MKYAIISDIHGNLEALDAVLHDAGNLPVLCLGDIVGYGADPNACVERIRTRANAVVMGNHDRTCSDGDGIEQYNPVAMISANWTNRTLTQENIDYLLGLPLLIDAPTYTLVHASPYEPELWHYVMNELAAYRAFNAAPDSLITFIGHSHYPCLYAREPDGVIIKWTAFGPDFIDLRETYPVGTRFVVNVGSVGQPRDRDPRAAYVVYDDEAMTVRWNRVDYDIAAAQAKIRATSMPERCADRLATAD